MRRNSGPLALFAALELEASMLASSLSPYSQGAPGIAVRVGALEGRRVVLAIGGIGKVAAAMTTQFLCDTFEPSGVICFGLAGAISGDARRGQVIVASGAVQHDLDVRPLTRKKGEIPGFESGIFDADTGLAEILFDAAGDSVEHRDIVQRGLVLTGDQIVTSSNVRDRLAADFAGAACVDMETAALAQVASRNGLPWAALRLTSDAADETFQLDDVLDFGARTAGELFERIIRAAMRAL